MILRCNTCPDPENKERLGANLEPPAGVGFVRRLVGELLLVPVGQVLVVRAAREDALKIRQC